MLSIPQKPLLSISSHYSPSACGSDFHSSCYWLYQSSDEVLQHKHTVRHPGSYNGNIKFPRSGKQALELAQFP